MDGKLKLNLSDLRVETFETVGETGWADGTVQALCAETVDCSLCTTCTACTGCTVCTGQTNNQNTPP
ncbi:MAG TPA: hypothetical protein VF263_05425 [Longimicrobiaceae bacterium]